MEYIQVFIEGLLNFISPCILPMIPIVLGFLLGENAKEEKKVNFNLLLFISGFTVVFVLLGTLAGSLGSFVGQHMRIINIFFGVFLILMGINYTGLVKIPFLSNSVSIQTKKKDFISALDAFIFGVFFALAWSPCTGAYLAAAIEKAANTQSVVQGALMLFIYSLGIGLPFYLSGLFISKLKGIFGWIKQHYTIINILSGLFLIGIGIYNLVKYVFI